ncbi:MAG TPA: adenosylmethionine--8-amino-7-oxononanoate transaminase [Gammaproteobacteria bacterium]|jgi:adenosylmethionine-8-amino-7-oxononanoate aminotransferase|nr:adenosylmethionine--8-amino-7-oxononanoate transaminase [Gammaproteobacteria bacterium]
MNAHITSLITKDLQHIWHPCSQMKDYLLFPPLIITGAQGSYLELAEGGKVIDAISSWWCKTLGHQHPRLKNALLRQLEQFEHVIFANTTHETIVQLSEKLTQLMPTLNKVFYAGDGSCAVEVALKMSLHARQITRESKKTKFIALKNGYHGETLGALSVSDLGLYRTPYQSLLFDAYFIDDLPYVLNKYDPLWFDCTEHWQRIEKKLMPYAETTTAIILEPIVQGVGGMQIYSQDFLKRLRSWTQQNGIHLIADEIMTGIGRTGKMLACQHAGIEPDFLCLSKGLTGGWLPLSAVLTTDTIYQYFYADYQPHTSFLHSHTHSGNALAASVALEVLHIMAEEKWHEQASRLEEVMFAMMTDIAEQTGKLTRVRGIGAIVAADLVDTTAARPGFEVYRRAAALGALLRPLGNTIYWLPPLNIEMATLEELMDITMGSLSEGDVE